MLSGHDMIPQEAVLCKSCLAKERVDERGGQIRQD